MVKIIPYYAVVNLEAFILCFSGEYLTSKVRKREEKDQFHIVRESLMSIMKSTGKRNREHRFYLIKSYITQYRYNTVFGRLKSVIFFLLPVLLCILGLTVPVVWANT